jgi:hypothetical protein
MATAIMIAADRTGEQAGTATEAPTGSKDPTGRERPMALTPQAKPPDSGGFFAFARPKTNRDSGRSLLDIADSLC